MKKSRNTNDVQRISRTAIEHNLCRHDDRRNPRQIPNDPDNVPSTGFSSVEKFCAAHSLSLPPRRRIGQMPRPATLRLQIAPRAFATQGFAPFRPLSRVDRNSRQGRPVWDEPRVGQGCRSGGVTPLIPLTHSSGGVTPLIPLTHSSGGVTPLTPLTHSTADKSDLGWGLKLEWVEVA